MEDLTILKNSGTREVAITFIAGQIKMYLIIENFG